MTKTSRLRLSPRLNDVFPGSSHVQMLESGEATDQSIWKVAKSDGYLIVSKDTDFNDLAILRGPPPKVINIALGNCTTQQVESHLRMKARAILEFEQNPGDGLLILP